MGHLQLSSRALLHSTLLTFRIGAGRQLEKKHSCDEDPGSSRACHGGMTVYETCVCKESLGRMVRLSPLSGMGPSSQ